MAARRTKRTKQRGLSQGLLTSLAPKRVLRKWEESSRGVWSYRTESLEISVHGHINYPDGTLLVTTRPDIGLGRKELMWKQADLQNAKDQALEIVLQYCRKLYEELVR